MAILILFSQNALSARVKIPEGRFAPLYGIEKDQKDFLVKSFLMDSTPVTVGDFKKFLGAHPEWKKRKSFCSLCRPTLPGGLTKVG